MVFEFHFIPFPCFIRVLPWPWLIVQSVLALTTGWPLLPAFEATGVARHMKLPTQPTSLRIQPMGFNLFPASTKLKALIMRILKKSSQIVVFVV